MSREKILTRIRKGGEHACEETRRQELSLLHALQPDTLSFEENFTLFKQHATSALATLCEVSTVADIPTAIVNYLRANNISFLRCAESTLLQSLPWQECPSLQISYGSAREYDAISVTEAFLGVAETGTVVMLSADTPISLHFLPEVHIVVLAKNKIVATYEAAWNLIRLQKASRTVHFITGPSRTADIEQILQIGMHGPKQLHIILY